MDAVLPTLRQRSTYHLHSCLTVRSALVGGFHVPGTFPRLSLQGSIQWAGQCLWHQLTQRWLVQMLHGRHLDGIPLPSIGTFNVPMMTGVEGAGPTLEGVVQSGGRCGPAPTRSHVIRPPPLPTWATLKVASASLTVWAGTWAPGGDVNCHTCPHF